MVYIYALIGRLILLPALLWLIRGRLQPKYYRMLSLVLMLELCLSTSALLVHNYVLHPWMSYAMSAFLYYFFSLSYATVVLYGVYIVQRFIARRLGADRKPSIALSLSLACLTFFSCLILGWYNVYYPKVTYRSLDLIKGEVVWEERKLRVVLLTDIHIGEGITIGYIKRMVDQVEKLKPDVTLVGGDYIDYYSLYAYQPDVMAEMRRLSTLAPHGIYYVLGNHEYRGDAYNNIAYPEAVGGVLLRDSVVYPDGGTYAIIGRDDYTHKARASMPQMLDRVSPAFLTILLEHTPEELEELEEPNPIDLALYGHTHGGQLFPNQLLVWLRYGIVSGSAMRGHTELYVSSGVGSAGAPYRIGSRSEIVVYDITY